MTDYDRGAYAPEHDTPLAFDPRQVRGGGPAPFTLILSLIVLLALAGGGYLIYRHGVRKADEAPQLVGTPVGPTRTAPSGEPQSSDTSAGLQVYKTEVPPATEQHAAPAPAFAPPPEQPQPLPAPRPSAPVTVSPLRPAEIPTPPPAAKVASAPAPAPVAAKPAPAKPAPVKIAAAKPAPSHAAPPAAPAEAGDDSSWVAGSAFAAHGAPPARSAAPAAVKATPAPSPASTGASGGAVVQIGAFADSAQADKSWGDLARAMPGPMAGKTRKVETVAKDGKTLFRAYVGGFASRADAVSFCASLKAAGKPCFVK
jgi:outer membrane biosynthesis protein TonB